MSEKKHPGGRPTRYRSEYAEQAYRLCLLGYTDKKLAEFFGVTEQTINNWKKDHEGFFESIKKAKDSADAVVVDSLFQRAKGYEHPEDKIFLDKGEPVIVPTIKHYPPDPTSIIFWLKNRQPEIWREKQSIELTGKDGGPVELSHSEKQQRISELLEKRNATD